MFNSYNEFVRSLSTATYIALMAYMVFVFVGGYFLGYCKCRKQIKALRLENVQLKQAAPAPENHEKQE